MIVAIVAGIYIGLSVICAAVFWTSCVVAARADDNWRKELEAQWPAMPEGIDGVDLFAEEYGPPSGEEEKQ